MTKKSIARGAALSALGYGAFEILGGINEAGADDEDHEVVAAASNTPLEMLASLVTVVTFETASAARVATTASALQQIGLREVDTAAVAVHEQDDGKTDADFGGSDCDREEGEHGTTDIVGERAERVGLCRMQTSRSRDLVAELMEADL